MVIKTPAHSSRSKLLPTRLFLFIHSNGIIESVSRPTVRNLFSSMSYLGVATVQRLDILKLINA